VFETQIGIRFRHDSSPFRIAGFLRELPRR